MDIISHHQDDETGAIAESYVEQFMKFLIDHKYEITPGWETTLFKPDEIGPELSKAGIITRSLFVEELSDIIHTVRDFFSNGTINFNPHVDLITFKIHADATDVIFDNLIICALINTGHEKLSDIAIEYPLILELNKILLDYMAPEIIPVGNGEIYHMALNKLVKKLKTATPRLESPASAHKSLKLFEGKNGIYPAGLWPLRRLYNASEGNMIYFYISTLSLSDTNVLVEKKWPNANMRHSAFKVHSGHLGHKISVNIPKEKMTLDIAVISHQMITPFALSSDIGLFVVKKEPDEITPLFNLFIATCMFFNGHYYERAQKGKSVYSAIMEMAPDIISRHINDGADISMLVGPVGSSRYIHYLRQIISIVYNSNPERYDNEIDDADEKFESIFLNVKEDDGAFVIPQHVEKSIAGDPIDGGRFKSADMMERFEFANKNSESVMYSDIISDMY